MIANETATLTPEQLAALQGATDWYPQVVLLILTLPILMFAIYVVISTVSETVRRHQRIKNVIENRTNETPKTR